MLQQIAFPPSEFQMYSTTNKESIMRKINKIILCMVTILATTSFAFAGTVSDRDGYKYKTVKIGKQHWMAEDYRFETKFSKCADYRGVDPDDCIREYDFLSTIDSDENICPKGWRLPTTNDFMKLTQFVASDLVKENMTAKQERRIWSEIGSRLSSTSCEGGKNSVGFNASCMFDNVGPVYYGQVNGGKNRKVGETAFECYKVSGLGLSPVECPKGGWAVYLRVRCIEE